MDFADIFRRIDPGGNGKSEAIISEFENMLEHIQHQGSQPKKTLFSANSQNNEIGSALISIPHHHSKNQTKHSMINNKKSPIKEVHIDIPSLKVKDLKAELKKRGLITSGLKKTLQARLRKAVADEAKQIKIEQENNNSENNDISTGENEILNQCGDNTSEEKPIKPAHCRMDEANSDKMDICTNISVNNDNESESLGGNSTECTQEQFDNIESKDFEKILKEDEIMKVEKDVNLHSSGIVENMKQHKSEASSKPKNAGTSELDLDLKSQNIEKAMANLTIPPVKLTSVVSCGSKSVSSASTIASSSSQASLKKDLLAQNEQENVKAENNDTCNSNICENEISNQYDDNTSQEKQIKYAHGEKDEVVFDKVDICTSISSNNDNKSENLDENSTECTQEQFDSTESKDLEKIKEDETSHASGVVENMKQHTSEASSKSKNVGTSKLDLDRLIIPPFKLTSVASCGSKSASSASTITSSSTQASLKKEKLAEARKARLAEMRGQNKKVAISSAPSKANMTSYKFNKISSIKFTEKLGEKPERIPQTSVAPPAVSKKATMSVNKPKASDKEREELRKRIQAQMREKATSTALKYGTPKKKQICTETPKSKVKFQEEVSMLYPETLKQHEMSPMDTYELSDNDDSSSDESDYSSDDSRPRKKVPSWGQGENLRAALRKQITGPNKLDPDRIFGEVTTCNLEEIFNMKKSRYKKRASSGNWTRDQITLEDKLKYKKEMGYS